MATVIMILTILFQANTSWNFKHEFQLLQNDIKTLNTAIKLNDYDIDGLNAIGSGRGILLKNAILFANQKPIFGYGPDNLGQAYFDKGITNNDRPHNELIQFAASLG